LKTEALEDMLTKGFGRHADRIIGRHEDQSTCRQAGTDMYAGREGGSKTRKCRQMDNRDPSLFPGSVQHLITVHVYSGGRGLLCTEIYMGWS
jgi:hypothetical protein